MLTGWGERRPFHLITETQSHGEERITLSPRYEDFSIRRRCREAA